MSAHETTDTLEFHPEPKTAPRTEMKDAERIADLLVAANRSFMLGLKTTLNEVNLSYQHYHLLEDLSKNGPFIMKEIAAKLDVTEAAATGTVDRLAQAGYMNRYPKPGDRRKVSVKITPAGQDVLDRVHQRIRDLIAESMSHGPEDEVSEGCRELSRWLKS